MQTPPHHRAVGVFEDQQKAIEGAKALLNAGFSADQLVLVAREWKEQELSKLSVKMQHAADSGAATGAAVGGGVGLAAGLLTLLIPGIGIAAAGLAVIAAATGAASGGWFGAFAGMELKEEEAREFAAYSDKGHTVLVVRAGERREEANAIMVKHGAYDYSMSTV